MNRYRPHMTFQDLTRQFPAESMGRVNRPGTKAHNARCTVASATINGHGKPEIRVRVRGQVGMWDLGEQLILSPEEVVLDSPKPALKCETRTLVTVDSTDLEEFIRQVYGYQYDVVVGEEWKNYECHEFKVTGGKASVDDEKIEALRAGKPRQWSLQAILNALVRDGYIQAGDYSVRVSQ